MTCIIVHFSDKGRSCAAIVWVKMPNFGLYGRAGGADFQAGWLIRTRKREQTRGIRGHTPTGKFQI